MKLMLAKTIYWTGIGLLIGLGLACLGAMGWGLISMIPQECWPGFAIFSGLVVSVILFFGAFGWAEDYINNHETLDKDPQ